MTELQRYKEAVRIALVGFSEIAGTAEAGYSVLGKGEAYAEDIDAILNPPVEMEDVQIERWIDPESGDTRNAEFHAIPSHYVKLTGTLTRPKPVKVERSVSINAVISPSGISYGSPVAGPEWAEHRECHGKTGVLTFTWTE